jgi:hypothetical protein
MEKRDIASWRSRIISIPFFGSLIDSVCHFAFSFFQFHQRALEETACAEATMRLGTMGRSIFRSFIGPMEHHVKDRQFLRTEAFARLDSAAGLRPIGAKSPMRDSSMIGPETCGGPFTIMASPARRME